MMKRFFLASSVLMAAAGLCYGEAQRTTLTLENKFPELHKVEIGGVFQDRDFPDEGYNLLTVGPSLRYGLLKNLTVYGELPFARSSKDFSGDGSGLGDVRAGVQLLAYEDVFEYPWIVPHIDVSFNTGDGDKGTGYGENVYTFGVSAGTKMYDYISFVVDASYAVNSGFEAGLVGEDAFSLEDARDAVILSGSIVWDLSEEFAVLVEGKLVQDNATADEQQPKYGHGGFMYKVSDSFQLGAYVGGWTDADQQTDVTIKGVYSF